MAAITAPPPPPPAPAAASTSHRRSRLRRAPLIRLASSSSPRRPTSSASSSSWSSSSFSGAGSGGGGEILHVSPPPPPAAPPGAPVYVTLPADAVGPGGRVARRRAMAASFAALAAAGVAGVAVELWWGVVEREGPGEYDWAGYLELAAMARRYGLRVRAILAFHQCGAGPHDPLWIPLPQWVLEEMDKFPDLSYTDKHQRRNKEYISLGCDILPVLKGRSPMQAYSDFMRSFRNTFEDYLGATVTEVQVGMGPGGELRYPLCPTEKLNRPGSSSELGEFQCYDKFMQSSLSARAQILGVQEWGNGGPTGTDGSQKNLEETSFFRGDGGCWDTPYGRFFLEWYSGMLLLHGERLCMIADAVFSGTGVTISGKVAGIHWHYYTCSHPSELTAGYYNTLLRDGYLPIAQMFARYKAALCCGCFDLRDTERTDSESSPEGTLRQLLGAAKICNLPLNGENSVTRLDDTSLNQVIRSSRLYSGRASGTSFSFNYVRMNKSLFEFHNWSRFTKFVRQMSDARTFLARLDFRRGQRYLSSMSVVWVVSRACAYT
ncbi:beta-amylase 1, chloroplastic-like isoform X2 [Phragmites australis]|uniref:beta-amylase 1, chloroplastic-like isoform X2 n=1 Tax=Phragmites australis TaxID=29695 RepID=UPI002D7747F5|nr:beta-amylase 1, chloroplastic-like isoform X2 [Phragmites australis]